MSLQEEMLEYFSRMNEVEEGNYMAGSGWALYTDTQYSSGSPLVISQGTTVDLPNNAGSKDEGSLPTGSPPLYDGTRIWPNSINDTYDVRVTFKASTSSGSNGGFNVSLDISEAGDDSITVASQPIRMLRGSNVVQTYTVNFPVFCKETFKANGGLLRIESVTGNLTMYDVSLFLVKTYGG